MDNDVNNIITKVAGSLYKHNFKLAQSLNLELGDFISAAGIGMAIALKNFRPSKKSKSGSSLFKYAYNYMKSSINSMITHEYNIKNKSAPIDAVLNKPHSNKAEKNPICFNDILEICNDTLLLGERIVLKLMFLDNLSPHKISKRVNTSSKMIWAISRSAKRKVKDRILSYGDIKNMQDIKNNIRKAHIEFKYNSSM